MPDRSPGEAEAPAEESSPAPSVVLTPDAGRNGAGPAEGAPGRSDPIETDLIEHDPSEHDPSENGPIQHDPGEEQPSGNAVGASVPATATATTTAVWRRVLAALAWFAGAAGLFTFFLRITRSRGVNSDASNNALQAYDMLHGHLLLHGWIIGDATYYTFELPLIALTELIFGLHDVAMNVSEALVYLIVAAVAVAIAVTGSSGPARVARAGVVVAVLAAPALIASDMWIPLGIPDHTGTTIFLLLPCLLLDRVPARRYTAPLICFLLCAGQIGDVTVRYVAVPALAVACAYRILASRRIRGCDTANLLAVVVSLPLAVGVRAAMLHAGSYVMVAPKTALALPSAWRLNAEVSWGVLRELFGAQPGPGAPAPGTIVVYGYACLAVAGLGLIRVLWRWRTAHRADQVLLIAIVANMAVYIVSTLPLPNTPHDIVTVLPASAILAARALVPDRIASRVTALVAAGFALTAGLLPLSLAARQSYEPPDIAPLAAWLQAHGLVYGVGGYWDGSSVALASGDQVQIRPVHLASGSYPQAGPGHRILWESGSQVSYYPWETNTFWFDPTRHYANFAVFNQSTLDLISPAVAVAFGKPTGVYSVGGWEVLVYAKNLLTDVVPAALPPTS